MRVSLWHIVSGVGVGTAGRQSSSILSVIEAAG
jgi:hypothetical protein